MAYNIVSRVKAQFSAATSGGRIMRNMTMLAGGTAVAQVIGVISTPIITRIYLPEHMGVLTTFVALTSLLVPLGTLRYSVALPLPKSDGMATNLAVVCLVILAIMSLAIAFFLFMFAEPVLIMLSMEATLPYWWLLIIGVLGTSVYDILSTWAVREKAFKPLAKTKIWQSVTGSLVKIGLGFLGLRPLGLLVGQIISQSGGIFSLVSTFFSDFRKNVRQVRLKRIVFLLKYYNDFPKFRLPSQLLLVFSAKAPLLFSAWLFGVETTGQLGLALTILALPLSLFGQSIGQAYYSEIAQLGKKQPKQIYQITESITKKLFLISIPPFLILLFFGPVLFEIVFGTQWRDAGVFASALAVFLLSQFVSSPITNTLSVLGKEAYFLQINIVRTIAILAVFYLSFILGLNSIETIVFFSLTMTLHRIFVYFRILYTIRSSYV